MTTSFAHRTSIPLKELIESNLFTISDVKDGVCSARLIPSFFIQGEVWEHALDSSGIWQRGNGAFKNESMFLVKPKSTGLLDCDFQFCAATADAVNSKQSIFKMGAPGMAQVRVSLTEVLEKGSVVIAELLRFQALCLSLQYIGINNNPQPWPWGEHHTKALGHLAIAADRYWKSYDPSDRTTANTNEVVSAWLQKEHKVSKRMAGAIATMLRADDLPTGPRK